MGQGSSESEPSGGDNNHAHMARRLQRETRLQAGGEAREASGRHAIVHWHYHRLHWHLTVARCMMREGRVHRDQQAPLHQTSRCGQRGHLVYVEWIAVVRSPGTAVRTNGTVPVARAGNATAASARQRYYGCDGTEKQVRVVLSGLTSAAPWVGGRAGPEASGRTCAGRFGGRTTHVGEWRNE